MTSSYLKRPVLTPRERRMADALGKTLGALDDLCRAVAEGRAQHLGNAWLEAVKIEARALLRELNEPEQEEPNECQPREQNRQP